MYAKLALACKLPRWLVSAVPARADRRHQRPRRASPPTLTADVDGDGVLAQVHGVNLQRPARVGGGQQPQHGVVGVPGRGQREGKEVTTGGWVWSKGRSPCAAGMDRGRTTRGVSPNEPRLLHTRAD